MVEHTTPGQVGVNVEVKAKVGLRITVGKLSILGV